MTAKKLLYKFLVFLNVIFLVMSSGYVLTTTKYSPLIYNMIFALSIFNALYFCFSKRNFNKLLFINALIFFILIVSFATFSSILNPSNFNFVSNFKFSFTVLFSLTIAIFFNRKDVIKCYLSVIFWICVISIVGHFFINVIGAGLYLPTVTNSNEVLYRVAFVFFSYDGFLSFRNIGVFWEPGLFATMIFSALILNLYYKVYSNILFDIFLVLTMLTTFSSAGVILLMMFLILYLLNKKLEISFSNVVVFLVFLLSVFTVLYYMLSSMSDIGVDPLRVLDKIMEFQDKESHRLQSPIINFQLFLDKPFFGWGLVDGMKEYVRVGGISLTSTSTFYLMSFGVFGFIFTIVPLLFFILVPRLRMVEKLILTFCYFFILNKEPHVFFSINYVLLISMMTFLVCRFYLIKSYDLVACK